MGTRMQAGFTLLELLIILAIMGILASVAAINFPRSTASAEVAAANTELENVNTAKLAFYGDKQGWPLSSYHLVMDDFLVGELRARYDIDEQTGLIIGVNLTEAAHPWPATIYFDNTTQLWERAE